MISISWELRKCLKERYHFSVFLNHRLKVDTVYILYTVIIFGYHCNNNKGVLQPTLGEHFKSADPRGAPGDKLADTGHGLRLLPVRLRLHRLRLAPPAPGQARARMAVHEGAKPIQRCGMYTIQYIADNMIQWIQSIIKLQFVSTKMQTYGPKSRQL